MNQEELIKGLDLCANCNSKIIDDQWHIVNEMDNWCCECFHQKYAFCDNCGEDYEHKDMRLIELSRDDIQQYCKWCYKELKKQGEIK